MPVPALFILFSLLTGPFLLLPLVPAAAQAAPGSSNLINAVVSQTVANPEQPTGAVQSACLSPSVSDLSTQTISPSAGTTSLLGQIPPSVTAGRAPFVSTMSAALQLHMELTLNMRNAASFQQCLNAINDPSSPDFHDFLTSTTLEPYIPTPGERSSVITYLEAEGFQVTNGSSPLTLQLTASVAVVEAAFGIKIDLFSEGGQRRLLRACHESLGTNQPRRSHQRRRWSGELHYHC